MEEEQHLVEKSADCLNDQIKDSDFPKKKYI